MDSRRKGLFGYRRYGIDHSSSGSSNLRAMVRARNQLKEANELEKRRKILGLAEDCSSYIFLRLSAEDLQRTSCVCKSWNSIIMNPYFIECHVQESELGLLCLSPHDKNPKSISVESLLIEKNGSIFTQDDPKSRKSNTYLHFLEIKDGVSFAKQKSFNIGCNGRILGSCNGLVLLENRLKKGGLAVLNPVTRKVTGVPAGTIVEAPNRESYGFGFKSSTKEHVAVHLFQEVAGFVSCEILTVEKRKWAMVTGLPKGLFIYFEHKPVFTNGCLYWIHGTPDNDYILSMDVEETKFELIALPKRRGLNDRIVEIGGFLCFVRHRIHKIDIWSLNRASDEKWTKQYTINSGVLQDMIPVSGSRYCRWLMFRSNRVYPLQHEHENENEDEEEEVEEEEDEFGGDESVTSERRGQGFGVSSLYVYDFHLGVMNKVRTKNLAPAFHSFLPHVNSFLCS